MKRKVPPEAYAYYLSLGHGRSYQAVAGHYGVAKRTVTKRASLEDWQSKVKLADDVARAKAEERVQETLEEMNERHLKTVQLVQKKALEALRTAVINDPAKALVMAMTQERLIRGQPTDRTELDVAEIVKRESERWLTSSPAERDRNGHDQAPR